MNIISIIAIVAITTLTLELVRYFSSFHSFFKHQKDSWIGFDLDGTLAMSSFGKFNPKVIGDPIPSMAILLKKYLDEGQEVKIFTARVATNGTIRSIYEAMVSRYFIKKWCKKHIGRKLDVVSEKDFKMKLLYDDRAMQVKTDTGEILK